MSEPAFAFDTHKFVKNLTNKGFTEQQAEVLAEAQVSLLNSNLVTSEQLDKRISEVKEHISESKVELIKWIAGMLMAVILATSTMVVSLMKLL